MAEARSVREPWDGLAKRAVASILHDFYTGCERIFRRVALDLDGYFPDESNWHRRLLAAMASPLAEIRPAVISRELAATLDEYLGFRRVFSNITDSSWRAKGSGALRKDSRRPAVASTRSFARSWAG